MALNSRRYGPVANRMAARARNKTPNNAGLRREGSQIRPTPNPVHFMDPLQVGQTNNSGNHFGNLSNLPPGNMPGGGVPTASPGAGQYDSVIQSLTNQGIQASATPQAGPGWAEYAPGLYVYNPRPTPESPGLPDNVSSDLAYLTNPNLGQQYKDQAMADLSGQQGAQPPVGNAGGANYDSLRQQILQTQQAKNSGINLHPHPVVTHTPGALLPAENTNPGSVTTPQTPPIPQIPAVPPVSQTTPLPDTSGANPATSSAMVNPQQMANRGLPGFASVRPRPGGFQVPFGNLTNIANRMLQQR